MKKSEQELMSRAVRDADFRKRLLADPDGVITSEGYEVGDEARTRIRDAAGASPEQVTAAIESAAREGGVDA